MSKPIDANFINSILVSSFNTKLENILDEICSNYPDLPLSHLKDKYCISESDLDEIAVINKRKKRKKNKLLEKQELCMAKKADGLQCTRRKKNNCDYCGKHTNNLKFGRVDDEIKYQDTDKFIKTKCTKIDGTDYLVDDNEIVYSFDKSNPKVLGTIVDGKLVLADALLNELL